MNEVKLPEKINQPKTAVTLAARIARPGFLCLLLALLTAAVFWRVTTCDFINYDDPIYVTSNAHVQQGLTFRGALWAFTTIESGNWHPLTWLSHMADVQWFGTRPMGPHLVNLLLHTANTLLLFLMLRQLTGTLWRSALVAALFALHPLHVESVAWVSERKDVLSTFFFLLTLLFYAHYAQRHPQQRSRIERQSRVESRESSGERPSPALRAPSPIRLAVMSRRRSGWERGGVRAALDSRPSTLDYSLALLFFVLGLMSKPMLVTLPFVLLLLDYWPLGRVAGFGLRVSSFGFGISGSDSHVPFAGSAPDSKLLTLRLLIREKIPFFVCSALSCVVASFAQASGMTALKVVPLGARIANAFVSYARYLGKTFWPLGLAVPYPHPRQWPLPAVMLSVLLVVGLCVVALWLGRKLPFVVAGWFWFLGTLIPVIGLVQVGIQAMADRYSYVPSIGLFIILVWGLEAVLARWALPRTAVAAAGVLVLGACAARTMDQLRYWQNSETLFRHTIAVTKDNSQAYDNLGHHLYHHGHPEEALQIFQQALRIDPTDYAAYNNIGFHYFSQGLFEAAITNYHQALRINPNDAITLNDLGSALTRRKEYDEAIKCLKAALRLKPGFAEAHNNMGIALAETGRTAEGLDHFSEAIRLAPDNAEAQNNFGTALMAQGQPERAIEHYEQAVRLNPSLAAALNNLAGVFSELKRYPEAAAWYRRLTELNPNDEATRKNLGRVLAQMGRTEEAVWQLMEAARLAPNDPEAHLGLGTLLALTGHRDEAMAHLKEALRLDPDYADAKRELQALEMTMPK